jgi:hypothetical protein
VPSAEPPLITCAKLLERGIDTIVADMMRRGIIRRRIVEAEEMLTSISQLEHNPSQGIF